MKLKLFLFFTIATTLVAALFLLPLHAQPAPRRIEVMAKRFTYTPETITLKKGQPVTLVLSSADVDHGLRFRDFNVNLKVAKGKTAEATFTPYKTGDFVGQCSVFCGSGHGSMKMTIHVTE